MPQLPVILTAFANSYDEAYLSHLEKEHDRLLDILAPLSYLYLPKSRRSSIPKQLDTQRERRLEATPIEADAQEPGGWLVFIQS